MLGLGCILVAVAGFTNGDSIVLCLSGPAGVIFIGLGTIIWSKAILQKCLQRDRIKSLVTVVSALLALLIMTVGPLLIGVPILHKMGP